MKDFIISEREYSAISRELKMLKERRKELNQKLNDPSFLSTFSSIADYAEWKQSTERTLAEDKERTEYLKELAHVYLGIARTHNKSIGIDEQRQQRNRSFLTADGIAKLLIEARCAIERLTDDDWQDGDKILCGNIRALERRIRGDKELNGWLSPQDAQALRDRSFSSTEELKADHQRDIARLNRTISELRAANQRLSETKGRAIPVLEHLYAGRYEEVDTFRMARGVTHRIHLTVEDCKAIEDAIRG